MSYLKKTVRNAYIAFSKKSNLYKCISLDTMQEFEPHKNDNYDFEFNLTISNLSPLQQKVINLKYFCCYTDAEIGQKLNISRQVVNRLKNRALSVLRNEFDSFD